MSAQARPDYPGPILETVGLVKRFGGLVAVDGVDLTLGRGKILGMIGINGAGKTTVMNCINGIYRNESGRVRLDGADITHRTPHEIAHAGIGRTFQVPRIFHRMSLIDNLVVTSIDSRLPDAALVERAEHFLDRVNPVHLRYSHGEELSGGQQRFVELGRALVANPSVVLLDEPTAMIAPKISREIYEFIAKLPERGITVALVDQNVRQCVHVSDYVYILDLGRNGGEGTAETIAHDAHLKEMVAEWLDYEID